MTPITRHLVSRDGHRIDVTGRIPDEGTPTVEVRMDETEIIGSFDTCVALQIAIEDVLVQMAEMMEAPIHDRYRT